MRTDNLRIVMCKCALPKKWLTLEGTLATKLTDEVLLAHNRHLICLVLRHLPLKEKAFESCSHPLHRGFKQQKRQRDCRIPSAHLYRLKIVL